MVVNGGGWWVVARFIIALFEHIQNIPSKLNFTRPFNPFSTKLTKWSNKLPARKLCLTILVNWRLKG